jgi:uncharacterized membrane protein
MSPDIAPSSRSPDEGAIAVPRGARNVRWRAVLSVVACVAYPFLVYWVLAQRRPWLGLALTLAALLGLCASLPQLRMRVMAALLVLALAAAAVAFADPSSLLFLPPLSVNLGLAWFFGRTLAPGREALITRFARLERSEPQPDKLTYARRLTWVWTMFFLLMAAISAVLAASGAHAAWMWFTAVGNYLCVAALFALEYAYRRRRFPRDDHRSGQISPRQQMDLLRAALRERAR